jgi:hypothetical protein
MQIPEANANLKLGRWQTSSLRLVVQITIGSVSVSLSAAKLIGNLEDRLVLKIPTGQIMIPLSGATFEEETIESDSLTINFPTGGSCYLQASESSDPEWPKIIGD